MENFYSDNLEPAAKIVVIGVGGAGNNAVNRMIDEEITNVEFYVANTDKQALGTSKAPNRIILGEELTGGLGAGGDPKAGKEAAEASADKIREIVKDANMVFIAAGMGGGTGTGAAPVIANIAKHIEGKDILVVAIVTRPFSFEGKNRVLNSIKGLNDLKAEVDSLIVVSNDKLLLNDSNALIGNAFQNADAILAQSVRTVVNLICLPAIINLDFADVRNTLWKSGVGLIGYGSGSGPNRAKDAANQAISCPLIETGIQGARRAVVAITCGTQVSLFEAQECVNLLIEAAGGELDIKFGMSINDHLSDEIFVSVIASDFENDIDFTAPTNIAPIRPVEQQELEDRLIDTAKREQERNFEEDSIIPNFLRDNKDKN